MKHQVLFSPKDKSKTLNMWSAAIFGSLWVKVYGNTTMVSAILTKGNNFFDFLFASLEDRALPKWGLLLKEKICS